MERTDGLPGRLWQAGEPLADRPQDWPVESTEHPYDDGFLRVRRDRLRGGFTRAVVEHDAAVGAFVLDDDGRVLLLEQYRHSVRRRLLQIPAGLCDEPGESPLDTARRELAEEAGLTAQRWDPLLSLLPSPGFTDEAWTVYLARDLQAVPEAERTAPEHEEADLTLVWVPLAEGMAAIRDGRVTDAMAASAMMAAWLNLHG